MDGFFLQNPWHFIPPSPEEPKDEPLFTVDGEPKSNIRAKLAKQLIDEGLIGIGMLGYSEQTKSDGLRKNYVEFVYDKENKQCYDIDHIPKDTLSRNQIYHYLHGKDVFLDEDGFKKFWERYKNSNATTIPRKELAEYFNPETLDQIQTLNRKHVGDYAMMLGRSITLDPFSQEAKETEETLANIIVRSGKSRLVHHAIRTGHKFIIHNTSKFGEDIGGFYFAHPKTIAAAATNFDPSTLGRFLAHELNGHFQDSASDITFTTIERSDQIQEEVRNAVKNINSLLSLGHSGRIDSTRNVSFSKLQQCLYTKHQDRYEITTALSFIRDRLQYCLPVEERVSYQPGASPSLEQYHRHYLTTIDQINEIPAIIHEFIHEFGKPFVQELLPNLLDSVRVHNLNSHAMRADPKKAMKETRSWVNEAREKQQTPEGLTKAEEERYRREMKYHDGIYSSVLINK